YRIMAYRADQTSTHERRSVVISGAGIVTSMGCGVAENAVGFRAGRTAFREVDLFDVSQQRVSTAGQAPLPDRPDLPRLTCRQWRWMDRGTRFALTAAEEALRVAGLRGRMPVIVGTSAGAMPLGEEYYRQALAGKRAGQLRRVEHYQSQRQMTDVMRALGVYGPLRIISNACASGANAIGHAFHLVREGKADRVLAGGYDGLAQLVFAGFDSLQALAPSGIPRPFDAHRDGLAIGEGAGFVVVESEASARAREATVQARILGYGAATDVHHLTQPHPEGDAALWTMSAATQMAGLKPEDIDYINSHGTGTPLNDVAEAAAIRRWAGETVANVQVSSTKSAIGHLLGGAGAVESVICLMALEGQWLPANLGVREMDPAVEFDLVCEPRSATVNVVLTNSFGFGGANATLVMGRGDSR
ncbi:MAG: beta-ketoacyl-[acyl-carrier-protein] synthase family protein, partial [Verrucomicrobiales bacterium]